MNLNARITSYFLGKPRINILILITLILFGIGSVTLLKTTGFPSPEIKISVVNTIYPGASAGTVLEQVTKPLEASIKDIKGVQSYASTSSNNISIISITIDQSANADTVKSKVDNAVRGVILPEGAHKPETIDPKVSGDAYYFSIAAVDDSVNKEDLYNAVQILKTDIEKNSDVNKVNFPDILSKKVVVSLDDSKLKDKEISSSAVENQLKTWGLDTPIGQGVELNNKRYNISFTTSGQSLDDFKNIQITSSNFKILPFKLSDIANVDYQYFISGNIQQFSAYKNGDKAITSKSFLFSIDVSKDANLGNYDIELQKIINKYFDTTSNYYNNLNQEDKTLFSKLKLIKIYSIQDSNQSQVQEVVSGLIGQKSGDGILGYAGFVLGGIELVFLAMLLFVSWRAAIVSALAIPLSFFFSTILLKATGNDLNTLVLFSLVLVIGLVVDPALVVLESIQRNFDNGLKGKEAVIKAITEIGGGLFMAVLTSVLVFIPFGVVSGIFGQIISYIPLTILPALIGSYIVPLIFLSWIGGLILRRSKKSHDSKNEEENLWPIAKGLIKLNEKILNSHWSIRLIIIIAAIVVPFLVAGAYIGSKQVRFVQFSQASDADRIDVEIVNLPQQKTQVIENNLKNVLSEIIKNDNVTYVAPFSSVGTDNSSITFVIGLKKKSDRTIKAKQIALDLQEQLNSKFKSDFFDISINAEGVGVPTNNYPISLAIKTPDFSKEKNIAADITKILNTICKDSKGLPVIKSDCLIQDKVIQKIDDGFQGKETKFIEVKLNRDKTKDNPVDPFQVQFIISKLFNNISDKKIATFKDGNKDLDIVIANINEPNPSNIEGIKNVDITTLKGKIIKLSDIADITEVESLTSIKRVKAETVGVINARPIADLTDQSSVVTIQNLVISEFNKIYKNNYSANTIVDVYSEGTSASIAKSFGELGLAFLLAIILTYIVLVIFFNSLTQPLVILFSIPLTFLGIFPGLAAFGQGQLGFLEIIGIIILVGLVENVGIFLMDAANQKVREGWDIKKAIAYASGVRFRPIFLTKITTLVSTAPLAITSEFYRSLSVVVICGLLTSGFISLIISPILYVFFRQLSLKLRRVK